MTSWYQGSSYSGTPQLPTLRDSGYRSPEGGAGLRCESQNAALATGTGGTLVSTSDRRRETKPVFPGQLKLVCGSAGVGKKKTTLKTVGPERGIQVTPGEV